MSIVEPTGDPSTGVRPDWHLAAIIRNSQDAIITKSLEGIITSWNPAAERIFGYSAKEAIGRPISLIFPPDRGEEEPEILRKICSGEAISHFETKRLRKDGRIIDVSISISPILDPTGKIVGASKIARDITQEKAERERVRLERERLSVTLSSIGDAVIVTDSTGQVHFLNPVAETLTGWKQQEATGKPLELVFNIVNEHTRSRVENPAVRAIGEARAVPLANHTLLIARDGTEMAIDDSAAPIFNGQGAVTGVVLVFRDVTAARAIQESRARLSAIVENSDDAIIGKDLEGRITTWNKSAERIFGYTAEEAIGRPVTMLIPPDRLSEETQILKRLRAGERVDHFTTVRITKSGARIDVSLTISPIRDGDGRVVGASKIARDVTETKKAERDLAHAHAQLQRYAQHLEELVKERTAELSENLDEIETFSSSLSHDLKAPLRAINAYSQQLLEDYAPSLPPEGREVAVRITRSCLRLSLFVDGVLSYTRLRGGPVELSDINPARLIQRILDEHPQAREAKAVVKIEQPMIPIRGNEGLLMQVISNLVSNAVKFVPAGRMPLVRVWTEKRGGRVRLWVEDNGIGIEADQKERIFTLFTRLHTTSKYEGSGIGLAVVQRAVRRMGGQVGVESEPGLGSRFWIELGAAKQDDEEEDGDGEAVA